MNRQGMTAARQKLLERSHFVCSDLSSRDINVRLKILLQKLNNNYSNIFVRLSQTLIGCLIFLVAFHNECADH